MTETAKTDTDQTISGKFEMLPVEALSLLGKKIRTPDGGVMRVDGDDLVWWMFFFTFLHQKTLCYQTRKTISDRFDCDERTVSRRTARLEELGLLTIEKRKGTSSIYTATSVEQFLLMRTDQKVTPKEESDGEKTKKQPVIDAPATAAPAAGVGKSIPPVDAGGDADLSGGDDPSLSDLVEPDSLRSTDAMKAEQTEYTSEQLSTKLRKWRNWGLDDEARVFCLSQGVNDDTDSMALFIQRYQMPVSHQIPGEIPQWDEKIPF